MGKWIRWWGLGVFVIVASILAGVWVVFVDGWVKCLIEDAGTEAVGAKVELDAADLSLFPVGLALSRLQVTDPKKPMTNAVEVSKVSMGLDGLNLLRRKIIVDEMTVEGVRVGTPRATSGATLDVPSPDEESGIFSIDLPSLEVPDVKKILEQEDLETIRLIESLKVDLKTEQEIWQSRLKKLSGKSQLAEYKQRVKRLKDVKKGGLGGILGGVGEVQSLKQDIEQEIRSLKGAKKEFEEKVALLHTRLEQVKIAPKRDIQHLKAKYNLSPQGLANMSQALLGKKIGSWVHQGAEWYGRAKPFLDGGKTLRDGETGPDVRKPLRGKGVDVHFKEARPLPDFLIRRAAVTINLDLGELAGTVFHITNDQPTFGQPTTFTLSGEQLEGVKSIVLEGALNHVVPNDPKDKLVFQAKGYELRNLVLSKDAKWPLAMRSGLGDIRINALLKGQHLNVQGGAAFHHLQLSAGKEGDVNPLTKALSSAVTDISQLSLQAVVKGTLEDPVISLSSDLDGILQKTAGKMVNDLASKFGAKLQSEISAKIAKPLNELKSNFSGFEKIAGDLTERVSKHNGILKNLFEKNLQPKRLKDLPGGFTLPF